MTWQSNGMETAWYLWISLNAVQSNEHTPAVRSQRTVWTERIIFLTWNFVVLEVTLGFKPLTPELNPSAQRCLTIYFTGDFGSWTMHFVNICVQNQQMQQLFIQFINYVW
jgi:hypothetical protein